MDVVMTQGLELLVLGMGGVFLFLLILVILMNISAGYFKKNAHLFQEEEPAKKPTAAASSANEEVAVAIAAMTAHSK